MDSVPELEHFDLVVIGAGPAGEKAAAQAAYFKKRVAIIECEPEPGGAAVHTGTLPSKTLRETALYLSGYHARELYGVGMELDRGATLPRLMSRKNAIAAAEARSFRQNFAKHDVRYFQGHGRFVDEHTVSIMSSSGEQKISGDFVLICTGSRPHRPADIDFADDWIHDSDEILTIHDLPTSMTILGGGVIGCEYACMFAALGVGITLVDARSEILPFLDAEIVARLKSAMIKLGIRMVQGQRWTKVVRTEKGVTTTLLDGSTLENEQLLFAAGRTGCASDLGLENVGLAPDSRGYIPVDKEYRTKVPHIFAAGDVVGRALYENNARGKITGDLEGITKLVVDAKTRKLIGVHVIGERATELVHIGQTAITLGGTIDVFIDMVFNYPTLADSYKYAAYECLGGLRSE